MSNEKEQNVKLSESSDKDEEVEVTNETLAQVPKPANDAGTDAVHGAGSSSSSDMDRGTKRLLEVGMSLTDVKKAMADPRLSKLAVSNPKKAKRNMQNRQSAAKIREKEDERIKRLEMEVEELKNNNKTKAAKISYLQYLCDKLTENTNGLRTQLEAWAQKKKQLQFENKYLVAENRHYIALHQQQLMVAQPYQLSQPGGGGAEAAPDHHVDTVANQDAAAWLEGDAAV